MNEATFPFQPNERDKRTKAYVASWTTHFRINNPTSTTICQPTRALKPRPRTFRVIINQELERLNLPMKNTNFSADCPSNVRLLDSALKSTVLTSAFARQVHISRRFRDRYGMCRCMLNARGPPSFLHG